MRLARDVEVEITLLPTEHGGRQGSAYSGYRPQFYYDGHDWDAQHEYPDAKAVHPGQTVRAYLTFISPQHHVGKLRPGKAFLLREGNKTVGYGAVIKLLELEESAKHAVTGDA